MRTRALAALLSIALLSGCDALEWQALRLFLAVNPNLDLGDGPVAVEARSERLLLKPVVDDLEFPWDLAFPDAATVPLIAHSTLSFVTDTAIS